MKRVALFAYPAWHSLSPAMQNAAFEALRVDARYEAQEVPPEELPAAVESLRDSSMLGANLTIPHKETVIPLLDTVSSEAQSVGAVNTIVRRGDSLDGYTTDVVGFQRALADLGSDVDGIRAVLLGAGGAGRAVAYALLMAGVSELIVHNRTADRAERLAHDFGRLGEIRAVTDSELAGLTPEAELLVNATSLGMMRQGVAFDETPIDASLLPRQGAVIDLIYRPARTRLLREAEAAGLATQNGMPMLVYQGAEAFSLWTGLTAPIELMREEAENMLAG